MDRGVQVINRVFDILELLSLEKDGLGVTEIANRLELNKSTVHRILSAMNDRNYIEKTAGRNTYRIGLKHIEISSVYLNNVELKTEAKPYLWELTSKTNQPSHLAILAGTDAVYIDKIEIMTSIRLYSQIGRRIPAYCSALGKSLLSGFSDIELDKVLEKCCFEKITKNTIVNKDELIEQVKKVRTSGWSVDDEEQREGIRCIASPVYDYRGKVIAAISVSASSNVFPKENDEEMGKITYDTACKISRRIGHI